jgi:DNA-binding MarR family transcriptional regulator
MSRPIARRAGRRPKSPSPKAISDPTAIPAPVTASDRIVLEIRKFIAATIFFNARMAEQAGLGLTDMQMLHLLQLYGPATPGRLATWTGLTSGGITVALDRLEKSGYIRRLPNPADRRSRLISLVPGRVRKIARLYDEIESLTRRLLARLPDADLAVAIRFFETLSLARAERDE